MKVNIHENRLLLCKGQLQPFFEVLIGHNGQRALKDIPLYLIFQINQGSKFICQFLQLIAEIFKYLPEAKVIHPERMINFVQWLAAMEMVNGAPEGVYQVNYSDCLQEAQLNSLLENPLAAAVYRFAERLNKCWEGRPSDLLDELNADKTNNSVQRSADWPKSSESLSKRLRALRGPLKSQGVFIEFTRGKHRTITINTAKIEEELY